ncbi:hypothetical protein D3C87_1536320 [compost metagenome]
MATEPVFVAVTRYVIVAPGCTVAPWASSVVPLNACLRMVKAAAFTSCTVAQAGASTPLSTGKFAAQFW